ncbi:MAG: hypothetical protein HOJ57_15750 [Lentisphaerae bacterium]|jgi:hypothetical protein|nr:hypothetical protein [Lentisphaerota bacterium]MBT5607395.1 hypothetical protein [Lentisphaerota bacterium]
MGEWMLPIIPAVAVPLFALVLLRSILAKRRSMFARAKSILETMDDPEERVELLLFRSTFAPGKGREQDARVREVEMDGWTFLKATMAPFSKTICSWGGGVNLHFVRERQADEKPEPTN